MVYVKAQKYVCAIIFLIYFLFLNRKGLQKSYNSVAETSQLEKGVTPFFKLS